MTSNMGSHLIMEAMEGVPQPSQALMETTKEQVFELLKQQIRPEFLNRIDEIIMFTPLTRDDVRQIVEMQIARLAGRPGIRPAVRRTARKTGDTARPDERTVEGDTLRTSRTEGYDSHQSRRRQTHVHEREITGRVGHGKTPGILDGCLVFSFYRRNGQTKITDKTTERDARRRKSGKTAYFLNYGHVR